MTTRKLRNGAVTAVKINTAGLTVPNALQAADSNLLGGHAASYFLPATGTAADSSLLGGHAASYFLPATGTAADSSILGGHAASYFLPATGTAADSSMLGGYPAATFYRLRGGPSANKATTVDTGSTGEYTSATIGADGLPLISYYDYGNGTMRVLHCGNAECTSDDTATTLGQEPVVATSVTIGGDGLPLIVYDVKPWYGEFLQVWHCGNAACSSGNTEFNLTDDVGAGVSVTIGADGLPLISYPMYSGGLDVVHCGNADCTSGNTLNTVDTGNDRDYTSVAIGADGLPLISYYNYDEETLNVFHCDDDACNSGEDETPLEGGGQYNSVTIGADGLPLVSYYGVGGLNVLHCGNADCSSGNTATAVDPAFSLGPASVTTSVTIGADGLPLIGYSDHANSALKVLHCGDVGCTSGNIATTVDTGQVGSDAALTIGADGLPLISYDDFGNGALKVLHCADAFCVSYFRRR